ncbi:MAG: LuxR C-terminal-related transcriptional regulator [Candidatus Accumulibacter sp.]|jgi:LuxR family maltose regulon positive regulatory protein|nr:LuxR C-terminal-related transcriptional regulator [Accumulibacter sp.]
MPQMLAEGGPVIPGARPIRPSHAHLNRPRVAGLLEEAMRRPVVSVCAGAGYGKTQAVYDLLQKQGTKTIWVQVSESDNMSSRFWENFTRTIFLLNPAVARRLVRIGFPRTDVDYERYLRIRQEAGAFSTKRVVVFDDFHLLQDKDVLRFMEKSLNAPLPNVTTVLISRAEPRINLINLVSKGLVVLITENELRFTESETAEFLKLAGLNVSSQERANICADTGGWAFALNLIALSLQKNPAHESYARAAMKLNVFRLLESEVFLVVSERLRRFLIRLSLIDHLAADLLHQLAEDPALLEEMQEISAYVRYDANIDAYLIHHLFIDYLRQKQDLLTPKEKRETWLKAGEWCQRNDFKIDAISYFDKARAYGPLLSVVYDDLPQHPPPATARFVLKIFDEAPPGEIGRIPTFPVMRLRQLLSLRRLDEAFDYARAQAEKYEARPESPFNNRVLAGCYIGMGYARLMTARTTDEYDFDRYFARANEYYSRSPFPVSGPTTNQSVGAWISEVGTARPGAMEEFIGALSRAVPHAAHMLGGCFSGLDDLARAELFFYRNELRQAEKYVLQALRSARENRQYDIQNRAFFYLLRIGFAQGDYPRIKSTIEELKTLLDEPNYPYRYVAHDIVMAFCHLRLGQPQMVADWIKGNFEQDAISSYMADFGNRIRARYFYRTGRHHELQAFFTRQGTPQRVLFSRIDGKALEAVCRYQIKDREGALESLREGWEMSVSNDIVMSFVQHGKDMRTLTSVALRDRRNAIPREWLERLNRQSATYAKRIQIAIAAYRKDHDLDGAPALSKRESQILADLYSGLSRSEICVSRNLSINTVKFVVNTLYTKLGADNVADAIRIAAEKKLIDPERQR